jgi:17beta-estradiol 17-dehydrogenase / very-long-chain 3-oxoacyl-CoA reductase
MASRLAWKPSWNLPSCIDRALAPVAPAKSYLAALGAVYLGVKAGQAAYCLGRGLVSYFLANPLHLGVDLRKVGEWAVITGASDGMGKEYAMQLAAKGLNIVLIARNLDKTERVAQEIRSVYNVLAKVIIVDLAQIKPDDVKNIQDQLRTLKIALLINNAGVYPAAERFLESPPTDEKTIEAITVNITALVLVTRAVLPLLLAQGKGYILNMSSGLGEKPAPGEALYSAGKTFVDYFSEALDYEYKSKGVRIQCIMVGMVSTNMLDKSLHNNPLTADTKDFVRGAISLIGFRQRHHGHWRHALMSHLGAPMKVWNMIPKH